MKVLIQGYNTYNQNNAGGVQTKIHSYLQALQKRSNIQVDCFSMYNIKVKNYDIMHFFKLTIENNALMQYAKKQGLKIVLSSIVPIEKKNIIKANLLISRLTPIHTIQEFGLNALKMADVIIAETSKEANFIQDVYKIHADKIQVIPNGVSSKLLNMDAELAARKFHLEQKVVLLPALIDSNKNQLNVIRALKNTNIPVLLMGGENPNNQSYFEQCKKEATDNIKFTGWVKYETPLWASCYANAKVVVLPSFHEIYGNVLFEGCFCGANVVVSNVLPITEWGFEKMVAIVNPHSIKDIKNKILKAYESPMSANLSSFVRKEFTWEAVVDKHIKIYNSLL